MRHGRWRLIAAFLVAMLFLSTAAPALARQAGESVHGIDPADMDPTADPTWDFYQYANGGWLERAEIPADIGAYGVFDVLSDDTTDLLLEILGELAAGGTLEEGSDQWKAVELFRQGVDLETRNAQGVEPIQGTLAAIDAVADTAGLHVFLEGAGYLGIQGSSRSSSTLI